MNDKQEQAIQLILRGNTDGEVCKKIGTTRETVNKWRHHVPEFREELAARRAQLWEQQRDDLTALYQQAVDILRQALNSPQENVRIRAALGIAKFPSIQAHLKPEKLLPEEEPSMLDLLAQALDGLDVTPKWLEKEERGSLPPPKKS